MAAQDPDVSVPVKIHGPANHQKRVWTGQRAPAGGCPVDVSTRTVLTMYVRTLVLAWFGSARILRIKHRASPFGLAPTGVLHLSDPASDVGLDPSPA